MTHPGRGPVRRPAHAWRWLAVSLLSLSLAAIGQPPAVVRAAAVCGANLIVNGNAEDGPGSDNGYANAPTMPGWTRVGALNVVKYSVGAGFPIATDPGPVNRGANFITGGAGGGVSVATAAQTIDISALSANVDAGTTTFNLAGYLGGYLDQDDDAVLTITFKNVGGGALGSATIGPVTPGDRGNINALLLRQQAGTVPVGARSIDVLLTMTRRDGSYNDGYADNLSLLLNCGSAVGGALTWYFAEGYTGAGLRRVPDDPEPQRPLPPTSRSPTTSPARRRSTRASPCRPTAATRSPSTTRPQGVGRNKVGPPRSSRPTASGIIAERPMYFTYNGATRGITGGHNVMGATSAAAGPGIRRGLHRRRLRRVPDDHEPERARRAGDDHLLPQRRRRR